MILNCLVSGLGIATTAVSLVLAWRFWTLRSGGIWRRAVAAEMLSKAAGALATLAFSLQTMHNVSSGLDAAFWNSVGPGIAIVLRLIIFGSSLISSVYLAHVLLSMERKVSHLTNRFERALQDRQNMEDFRSR